MKYIANFFIQNIIKHLYLSNCCEKNCLFSETLEKKNQNYSISIYSEDIALCKSQ